MIILSIQLGSLRVEFAQTLDRGKKTRLLQKLRLKFRCVLIIQANIERVVGGKAEIDDIDCYFKILGALVVEVAG